LESSISKKFGTLMPNLSVKENGCKKIKFKIEDAAILKVERRRMVLSSERDFRTEILNSCAFQRQVSHKHAELCEDKSYRYRYIAIFRVFSEM